VSLAFAGVGHASSTGPEAAIGVGIFPAVGAAGVVGIFPGVEDVAGRILPSDPVLVLLTLPFSPVPSCKVCISSKKLVAFGTLVIWPITNSPPEKLLVKDGGRSKISSHNRGPALDWSFEKGRIFLSKMTSRDI
jgi:hypothetical protein